MDFFSALGRSLMMPIAALAACGIVLGLTSALMKAQVVAAAPFLGEGLIGFIILVLNKVSGVVFTLLPVLFAISIAMGLAKEEKEVAAFAGFIGYYTFLVASSLVINTGVMDFSVMKISTILGVETLDMGAVAGILIGVVTASLHNLITVGITPYTNNPIATNCLYNLRFFTHPKENQGTEYTSRLCIFYTIDTLIAFYRMLKRGDEQDE